MSEKGECVEVGEHVTASYAVAGVADRPAPEILYVWVKMKDGRTLDVFFNRENDLLVVDVHEKRGKFGNEVVRMTLPPPIDAETRRRLSTLARHKEEDHDANDA